MPRFQSNSTSLYYAVDGEGPPIVLLHCLPMDHRVWAHQVFALSPRYRTVALDFRGLGLSERISAESCDVRTLCEDVRNLMDHEEIDQAIVVGISIGGIVAQELALNYPQRVRALVLCGTIFTCQTESMQERFSRLIDGYNSPDAKSHYERTLSVLYGKDFASSAQGSAVIRNYVSLAERIDFKSVAKLCGAVKAFDNTEGVTKIRVPTLVMAGEEDHALASSRELAERIPGAIFFSIRGCGHPVCIEDPASFNEKLLGFLESLERK